MSTNPVTFDRFVRSNRVARDDLLWIIIDQALRRRID